MNKDIAILFCLPLSEYPVKPDDISDAEPVACPECAEMMWFSIKKKIAKELLELTSKEIIFGCGTCVMKKISRMIDDGEMDLAEFNQINI